MNEVTTATLLLLHPRWWFDKATPAPPPEPELTEGQARCFRVVIAELDRQREELDKHLLEKLAPVSVMALPTAAAASLNKPGQARQARVVTPVSDQLKYTINQAAQRLGCCPRTVHNLCKKGKLHKRFENKKPYILHSDILSYLRTLPRIPTA
jgi:hypothetical protein